MRTSMGIWIVGGRNREVRSADEILATWMQTVGWEAMPFMPEMLQFCGKRFCVYKRADKTCDNIKTGGASGAS